MCSSSDQWPLWWTSALKHCNALSPISLILGRISLTSQRELLVKHFPKPHLGIFWITGLKDKQKKKILTTMTLLKSAKLLTTRKNIASTSLNEKSKITLHYMYLSKKNRYSPRSCILGVLRNCIINKRINVCIWQTVKFWDGRSHDVMTVLSGVFNLHHGYYTTINDVKVVVLSQPSITWYKSANQKIEIRSVYEIWTIKMLYSSKCNGILALNCFSDTFWCRRFETF